MSSPGKRSISRSPGKRSISRSPGKRGRGHYPEESWTTEYPIYSDRLKKKVDSIVRKKAVAPLPEVCKQGTHTMDKGNWRRVGFICHQCPSGPARFNLIDGQEPLTQEEINDIEAIRLSDELDDMEAEKKEETEKSDEAFVRELQTSTSTGFIVKTETSNTDARLIKTEPQRLAYRPLGIDAPHSVAGYPIKVEPPHSPKRTARKAGERVVGGLANANDVKAEVLQMDALKADRNLRKDLSRTNSEEKDRRNRKRLSLADESQQRQINKGKAKADTIQSKEEASSAILDRRLTTGVVNKKRCRKQASTPKLHMATVDLDADVIEVFDSDEEKPKAKRARTTLTDESTIDISSEGEEKDVARLGQGSQQHPIVLE
ncbi:uncharacterized protein STEHIDRAFT_108241 [Stereum hirsutum FP-91666 SS1]|uniref:uncharacterized protein n=1 Tax=Stereum hirsutum (strain FP-91666) TaxID=721885 RepID=UPI000440D51D|nr:uncharacterized protein STEHIDRAFT_108241 [Stereum hirsutum FP-91666 SS1]EIM89518.1 hypothetical protein STEHIDRAFT_108241 [Stereum hirsutum FP-91666 SS1]